MQRQDQLACSVQDRTDDYGDSSWKAEHHITEGRIQSRAPVLSCAGPAPDSFSGLGSLVIACPPVVPIGVGPTVGI